MPSTTLRRLAEPLLVALAAAFAATTSVYAAPVPTVLGIQVGSPPALPECPRNTSGGYDIVPIPFDCWALDRDIKDTRWLWLSDTTEAHAEFAKQPISLIMDGDNVAEIVIRTTGIESQQDALQALVAKFGKPTHYNVERLQNRMGARFVGVRVTWARPDVHVYFDSTSDDLDNGLIDIETPAEDRRDAASQRPPSL